MDSSNLDLQVFMLEYLVGLKAVLDSPALDDIQAIIAALHDAYRYGRQVFVVGNGGSAATAAHMACDLGKTVLGAATVRSAKRFRVVSLTDNGPLITAWANDVSYDVVFAEQLRNLATPGDLLIVVTASGNSPNIVAAVVAARELGVTPIGLLGFDGGVVIDLLDHSVVVHSQNYGHIEDTHMVLTHLITAYFKDRYTCGPLYEEVVSGY